MHAFKTISIKTQISMSSFQHHLTPLQATALATVPTLDASVWREGREERHGRSKILHPIWCSLLISLSLHPLLPSTPNQRSSILQLSSPPPHLSSSSYAPPSSLSAHVFPCTVVPWKGRRRLGQPLQPRQPARLQTFSAILA
jgi:hypothetical protein